LATLIRLENAALSLEVVPELGGKITSLRDRVTGREWLWTNPYLERRPAEPGESYVERHDTGGIDECFPGVHGELWSRPWAVVRSGPSELALSARGGSARFYELRRTLRLAPDAPRVELEYELESHDAREIAFVYCLHALFAIEPGMRIEVPFATPVAVVPDPRAPGFRPRAEKRFVPVTRGEAALVSAGGREALRVRFDPAQLPFVGLWQNYGGWSGAGTAPYFNLALEPGVGDDDSLERACANGTQGLLAPGARRRWWIALELAA
jgi:galactose mutarotase-like enzyme